MVKLRTIGFILYILSIIIMTASAYGIGKESHDQESVAYGAASYTLAIVLVINLIMTVIFFIIIANSGTGDKAVIYPPHPSYGISNAFKAASDAARGQAGAIAKSCRN